MISLLISVLILCLIVGVIIWAIGLIPLPAPFHQIAYAVVGIIVLLVALGWLAGYPGLEYGHPLLR